MMRSSCLRGPVGQDARKKQPACASTAFDAGRHRASYRAALVLVAAMLVCVVMVSRVPCAWATSDALITYDGAAHELTCVVDEGTDLFGSFKGLVPGDVRTQGIALDVRKISGQTRVYLRAETDASAASVLAPLSLDVTVDDRMVESANLADAFADDVLVATFPTAGSAHMRLRLTVPISMGNEIAAAQSHVRWLVTVQEEEGTRATATFHPATVGSASAQTGDSHAAGIVVALMLASAAAAIAYGIRRYRWRLYQRH